CAQAFKTQGNGIHDYPGWRWAAGTTGFTMLNTIQTPNDSFGGCRYDTNNAINDWPDSGFTYGASSSHPGGVNTAMADGSVRFVKDSIAWNAWWGLGTRNAGEGISADAY